MMLPAAHVVRGDIAIVVGRRDPTHTYHRPLIATALDDAFERMAAAALDALAPDAHEITVLHAYRIPFQGGRMLCRPERLGLELEACAREAMEKLVRSTDAHGVQFELVARPGDVTAVLLAEVAARACDLVVLGRPRERRVRLRRRSLAVHLLEAARCDVVIVDRS